MNLKLKIITVLSLLILIGCGKSEEKEEISLDSYKKVEKEEKVVEVTTKASETIDLENKGVGPIKEITLAPEVDHAMAAEGEQIFTNMCTACHKPTKKFIGPAPQNILERRSPEWVMNMILDPNNMVQNDPLAKRLLVEFNGSPMADQGLTEDQARAVVEYFRTL